MSTSRDELPTIYILSSSLIKKQAVIRCFDYTKYNIQYIKLKQDNLTQQPIFIDGILNASDKRISDFYATLSDKLSTTDSPYSIVISIENGLIPIDKEYISQPKQNIMQRPLSFYKWADICIVSVARYYNTQLCGNREYYISTIKIPIEKSYTEQYFSQFYGISNLFNTFGKFIANYAQHLYKTPILHNNWMKTLYGIDRVKQITDALQLVTLEKVF